MTEPKADKMSPLPPLLDFGREIGGDLAAAEAREWLVTNGLGGFACGTVAGTLTRRYHALLMAALPPHGQRTLLLAKIDEHVEYDGQTRALGSQRWRTGTTGSQGYVYLERFRREGTMPVWTFAIADALLEKRIWMEHGANTTYVEYHLVRGAGPLKLSAKMLVNYRNYHSLTHADGWRMEVQPIQAGVHVQAFAEAAPFYLCCEGARVELANVWYRDFELAAERERGLDHVEDHLHAATFHVAMEVGESVTIVASTNVEASADGRLARLREGTRELALMRRCAQANTNWLQWPVWIKQLVLAADQFVITRHAASQTGPALVNEQRLDAPTESASMIAGYPWFGDWGRDSMIALPGLLLATGRAELAASVLRTYARYVDRGMIPNRFPDSGEVPEYNSVDASLWFFEAARQYYTATRDLSLVRDISPALAQIISHYTHGTRYNIHSDAVDGLLYAGEPGVQLTWMDSKVGDWVVTPRIGKPVEVNALWLNALMTQAGFAQLLGQSPDSYLEAAARARQGFQRFWNPQANCCFDVIDGPDGNDASVRPNQILAVALEERPLTNSRQRAVVGICARELLTSFGLRSLSPRDSRYCGHYGGDVRQRDGAYHQGTVWGWLIGPFVQAFLRVTGDREQALSFLAPFENHLKIHGLGTASEIFDGDPPFNPKGCFAQAWSVGELLRAWSEIERWE